MKGMREDGGLQERSDFHRWLVKVNQDLEIRIDDGKKRY
jgi:hypothetical protein